MLGSRPAKPPAVARRRLASFCWRHQPPAPLLLSPPVLHKQRSSSQDAYEGQHRGQHNSGDAACVVKAPVLCCCCPRAPTERCANPAVVASGRCSAAAAGGGARGAAGAAGCGIITSCCCQ